MWASLVKQLAKYSTAVLTVNGPDGYPYSVRCKPEPDGTQQVLKVVLPVYVEAQPGPAALLCHYHDDQLWNQTNAVVRGTLEQNGDHWVFRPAKLIEGAGAGMSLLRQIRDGRSAAKRYLEKRNLQRPKIPWGKLAAIYDKAQKPR